MAVQTNHPNSEVDNQELTGSTINHDLLDNILQKLDGLKEQSFSEPLTPDKSTIFGNSTLDNGGFVGQTMQLVRAHLHDSVRKNELSKQEVGNIYAQALLQAIESSVETYKFESQVSLNNMKAKADLLSEIIDAQIKVATLSKSDIEFLLSEFELKELMPLDRELKKEAIEQEHIKHDILQKDLETSTYNLSTMLPKQLEKEEAQIVLLNKDATLKDKDGALKDKNLEIETYNLSTVLPKQIEKEDAQITLMGKDAILKDKDADIKTYNLSTMLPKEAANLDAKTSSMQKDIELKEYEVTNLMPQRLELDTAKADLAQKELEFKTYEFTEMLPLNKTKLENEALESAARVTEANAKADIMGVEKLIKTYYKNEIQPEEKKEIESKARIAAINAALNGNVSDSLPYKRMEVIDKQNLVYEKQIGHYEDQKNLDLLKIITNYQSMIYPDLIGDDQQILGFANSQNAGHVYTALAP